MDIDEFKAINDTYGHNVGDHALREVAAALQGGLRPYDLCVRYAGDEFIVVLADCSREAAEAKRRELQERIGEIRDRSARRASGFGLAASAGAAVFPHDGATYEALLADADQRMYRDKAARRGQHHSGADTGPADVVAPPASISRPRTSIRRSTRSRRVVRTPRLSAGVSARLRPAV